MSQIERGGQTGAGAPGDGRRTLTGTAATPRPAELVTQYKALPANAHAERAAIVNALPIADNGVVTSSGFGALVQMVEPELLGPGYTPPAINELDNAHLVGMLGRAIMGVEPELPAPLDDLARTLQMIGAESDATGVSPLGQAIAPDVLDAVTETLVHELVFRFSQQTEEDGRYALYALQQLPPAVQSVLRAHPDIAPFLSEHRELGEHALDGVDPETQWGRDEDVEAEANRLLGLPPDYDPDQD